MNVVESSVRGIPTDPKALVTRYRNALAEALEKLDAFGFRADADEVAARHGFVYFEAKPEIRLSQDVPPAERAFDEVAR